jgi:hypothetical protein
VVLVIANYPEPKGFAPQLFRFSVICLWGAIFHIGTQLALWAFSGFPDGAERQAVRGLAMLKTRIVCLAA